MKRPLEIFREYNHMSGGWSEKEIFPINPAWLAGYDERGIEYRKLTAENITWWDREILDCMASRGTDHFRRIAIWDQDWSQIARYACIEGDFSDPRTLYERFVHRLLQATQANRGNIFTRALEYVLRKQGW